MERTISSLQLVYANVEREQSPTRRRGFQTVFHTKDDRLGIPEVLELEMRLAHEAKGPAGPRFLYFQTKKRMAVVVRFLPLEEADRFGRSGRYFAHALIFAPEEFAELDRDPFAVIRAPRAFFAGLERVFLEGDPRTGEIGPARFAPAGRPSAPPSGWAEALGGAAAHDLILAAARATTLASSRRTVALIGEPTAVLDLLDGLFALLPGPLRSECSFDSWALERSADKHGYWAVGMGEGVPRRQSLLPFALSPPGFRSPFPIRTEGAFDRWLGHVTLGPGKGARPLDEWLAGTGAAYRLALALDGKTQDPVPEVDEVVAASFIEANDKQFERALLDRLRGAVGAEPPEWLLAAARRWMEKAEGTADRLRARRDGPSPEVVAHWVAERLKHAPRSPAEVPLGPLIGRLRDETSDRCRLLQTARLRAGRDWKGLRDYLLEVRGESGAGPWSGLVEWVVASLACRVRLGIFPRGRMVVFGCTTAGAGPGSTELVAAAKALLAPGRLPSPSPLDTPSEVYADLVGGVTWLSGRWLEPWVRQIRTHMGNPKLVGFGWVFLPHSEGFMLGFGYDPPEELDNTESVLDWFEVPPSTKVGVLSLRDRRRKKGPAMELLQPYHHDVFLHVFRALVLRGEDA